jgi:hypothetical protein
MDVRDVQHGDLVTTAERVGLDGRVRLARARHDPLQLVAEIADASDRPLHRTEQLREDINRIEGAA